MGKIIKPHYFKEKRGLFFLVLASIVLTAFFVIKTNKPVVYKKGASVTYDNAVSASFTLYKKMVSSGMDMSSGPCLTNDLMPGWVVDIVHSPREKMDDDPKNQCPAYLEGRAEHFIELDLNGNLVRVR